MKRTTMTVAMVWAIAGCGGSNSAITEKSVAGVRATMRAYLEDIKDGRGGDACDLLTDAARTQTGRGNPAACGAVMTLARSFLGAKELASLEAKIGRLPITITGDHATAPTLTSGGGATTLVYRGGQWLIGNNS